MIPLKKPGMQGAKFSGNEAYLSPQIGFFQQNHYPELCTSNTEQFLTPVECTFWVNIPNWTIHHNLLIFLFVPYCSVFEVHNLGS